MLLYFWFTPDCRPTSSYCSKNNSNYKYLKKLEAKQLGIFTITQYITKYLGFEPFEPYNILLLIHVSETTRYIEEAESLESFILMRLDIVPAFQKAKQVLYKVLSH